MYGTSFATESAFRTGNIDWACTACGHRARLRVTTEAVAAKSKLGVLVGALDAAGIEAPGGGHDDGAQRRARAEADRRFRAAGKLVLCPRCGLRNRAAHAFLIAQVCTIGVVVGLIGAVVGFIGACLVTMQMGGELTGATMLLGLIGGEVVGAAITSFVTYRRRISDINRWARFLAPGEETDDS